MISFVFCIIITASLNGLVGRPVLNRPIFPEGKKVAKVKKKMRKNKIKRRPEEHNTQKWGRLDAFRKS